LGQKEITMTSMKTPEQVADEAMTAFTVVDGTADPEFDIAGDVEECSVDYIRDVIIGAIEADRAQRSVVYQVGDPDPTPDHLPDGQSCFADVNSFICTWEREHEGRPHVAGDGEIVVAVWD